MGFLHQLDQLFLSARFLASLLLKFLIFVLALLGASVRVIYLVLVDFGSALSSWAWLVGFVLQLFSEALVMVEANCANSVVGCCASAAACSSTLSSARSNEAWGWPA